MKKSLSIIFFLILGQMSFAQVRILPKSFHPVNANFTFGVQLPGADLAQRFGRSFAAGGGFEYARIPSGWLVGVDGQFTFGQVVKEDVLAKIRTADGNIISDINTYADVELRQRGYYIGGFGGRIFKLHDDGNHFGGIRATFGVGMMMHRIRIQDNQSNAPSLEAAYARGYDRYSMGLAMNQFIGYQMISRDRTFSFIAGFDFTEGFTKNRRGFNFDTGQRDDGTRFDVLAGFRVGWQLAIFTNQTGDEIEY
jgi:hypothetical protein